MRRRYYRRLRRRGARGGNLQQQTAAGRGGSSSSRFDMFSSSSSFASGPSAAALSLASSVLSAAVSLPPPLTLFPNPTTPMVRAPFRWESGATLSEGNTKLPPRGSQQARSRLEPCLSLHRIQGRGRVQQGSSVGGGERITGAQCNGTGRASIYKPAA